MLPEPTADESEPDEQVISTGKFSELIPVLFAVVPLKVLPPKVILLRDDVPTVLQDVELSVVEASQVIFTLVGLQLMPAK